MSLQRTALSSPTSWKAARQRTSRLAGGSPVIRRSPIPRHQSSEEPAITEADLSKIEEGTQVFHKSFGYGEVISIGSDRSAVRFDNDKKKKDREFMFPSTFYQGMLQL